MLDHGRIVRRQLIFDDMHNAHKEVNHGDARRISLIQIVVHQDLYFHLKDLQARERCQFSARDEDAVKRVSFNAMADVAADSNIRALAAQAVEERAFPATSVVKEEAFLEAGQIAAPAYPAGDVPAASPILVCPHGAG